MVEPNGFFSLRPRLILELFRREGHLDCIDRVIDEVSWPDSKFKAALATSTRTPSVPTS